MDFESFAEELNGKNILITGGTGSFGQMLTEILCTRFKPKRLVIFSRDEYKQFIMQQKFSDTKYPFLRYFIGDIRDGNRLDYAFKDIEIIFHAAALKQVPTLEYNPMEAIRTNIHGAEMVIHSAIKNNVKKVVALSTDKSVSPVNLYGATKMCMERLFISANYLSGKDGPIFSIVRYGNVFGSRGSVIPLFFEQKNSGVLTITHEQMTRFTLTLENAVLFVLNCLKCMIGGEIFIPKLSSYNIMQLANIVSPECEKKIVGIRPGEKLHESLIGTDESYTTLDCSTFYVITPFIRDKLNKDYLERYKNYQPEYLPPNFCYNSGDNELILDEDLKKLIDEFNP